MIQNRKAKGMVVGPPSETWSAVRRLLLEGGRSATDSAQGCPTLTGRCWVDDEATSTAADGGSSVQVRNPLFHGVSKVFWSCSDRAPSNSSVGKARSVIVAIVAATNAHTDRTFLAMSDV
jgi:hypothetical protein